MWEAGLPLISVPVNSQLLRALFKEGTFLFACQHLLFPDSCASLSNVVPIDASPELSSRLLLCSLGPVRYTNFAKEVFLPGEMVLTLGALSDEDRPVTVTSIRAWTAKDPILARVKALVLGGLARRHQPLR